MAERTLDSFSKEALIVFIKRNLHFANPYWERDLRRIERDLEFKQLQKESHALIEKAAACKLPQEFKAYRAAHRRLDAIYKRQDEIMQEMAK
jgi:hypothetical protein